MLDTDAPTTAAAKRGRPASAMPASVLDLLADVPEASGERLRAARTAAGLTQAQASALMGLAGARSVANAEAGPGLDRWRLALLLLATGQHPGLAVARRKVRGSQRTPPVVEFLGAHPL